MWVIERVCAQAYGFTQRSKAALIDQLAILFEQKRIVLPQPQFWPEGIDELESFEFSVTDSGTVRTGAPAGYHDDCVVALGLAAWIPGKRDEKVDPAKNAEVILKMLGRLPVEPPRRFPLWQ